VLRSAALKMGRKSRNRGLVDDDEYLLDGDEGKGASEEPADGGEAVETKKKKEKKGKKGKKKGGRAALDVESDGEEDIQLGDIPGEVGKSEDEEEEENRGASGKTTATAFHMLLEEEGEEEEEPSGTSAATGFDLLAEEDDGEDARDQVEAEVGEGTTGGSSFALLDEGAELVEEGPEEKLERQEGSAHAGGSGIPQLKVATIAAVEKHPKADRLRYASDAGD